jgi:sugar lactone lactonase YvrE
MTAELILDARNATGESPVWSPAEQALYWSDIPARRLYRWHAATATTRHWDSPEMIGCIAPHAAGGWIAGMETGIFHIHPHDDGTLHTTLLKAVEHGHPGMRFNDGRCDRQGRFLSGTMVLDMPLLAASGCVYSYENKSKEVNKDVPREGQALRALVSGMTVPNGMAFSPDGRTMYLSDTTPAIQTVWAFDYDTDTGTPSRRRVFVDMHNLPGRPDGAAMDQDGCYWVCGNDAGLIHRFTPDGRLDKSLPVPVKKPAMCAFGGPGLDQMFVTSIRPSGIDLSDQPLAGGVFVINPGTRGLPEPSFSA